MALYVLSMIQPDGPVPPPEVLEPVMAQIGEMIQELKSAGNWVFGGGLHDASAATVVRAVNGEVLMTDGPYVEGKEHIGGFSIIRAPDLDVALSYASRLTKITTLPIEVRPFQGDPH
jgi:hypothetical protein